jgi:hypothetical protein
MSRHQIPGPYPPADAHAPTPAKGVPAQPALWRVVRHDPSGLRVHDAPPALTATRAAEMWAESLGATGRVTVRCGDGAVVTVRIDAATVYTATVLP